MVARLDLAHININMISPSWSWVQVTVQVCPFYNHVARFGEGHNGWHHLPHHVDHWNWSAHNCSRDCLENSSPGSISTVCYQELLPTIYEVPMTSVEGIKRQIIKHRLKWLWIPPSFTSVGLYIRSGQLQLPLSSVIEEFKVAKYRAVMMLSKTPLMRIQRCRWYHRIRRQMGTWYISCTGRKPVEINEYHYEPVHRQAGTWIHPLPAMGESRLVAEERHDPSQSPTPLRRKAEGLGLLNLNHKEPGQVGPVKMEDHAVWTLETGAFFSNQCMTPFQHQHICIVGTKWGPILRTHWQDARLLLVRGDTGVTMTRSSVLWLTSWSRRQKKNPNPHVRPPPSPVHRGGRETTILQEDQEGPPASGTIMLDEGGPGKKTILSLGHPNFPRPSMVIWSKEAKKVILWEDGCEEAYERKATYQELGPGPTKQRQFSQFGLAAGAFQCSPCGTRSQHWE